MSKKEKSETKKLGLEEFIKEHYYMFTVLGVFGGLTALFTKLENASYLAFLSFTIFIVLDLDIWIKFPKSEEASLSLKIFEILFQIYFIAVGVYLVQAYPDYVALLLPTFLMLIFAGLFLLVFARLELFKPIRRISPPFRRRSTIIRMIIGMSIIMGLFLVSMALGTYLANLIKDFFKYSPTS
jgi:hypothetical protein